MAWSDSAWNGPAWRGRHGQEGHGRAGHGSARRGQARQARRGTDWQGMARQGEARQAGPGLARHGAARRGLAGTDWIGMAWHGVARQARRFEAGSGREWRGIERRGKAGRHGKLRQGTERRGRQTGGDTVNYDSPAVLALKDELYSRPCPSTHSRKRIYAQIRSTRLREARLKGTHTEDQWLAILDHFAYRCVRCGCTPVGRPCKDHIVPIYCGGSDGLENLQPLCRECNTQKGPEVFNWAAYRDAHGFEAETVVEQ